MPPTLLTFNVYERIIYFLEETDSFDMALLQNCSLICRDFTTLCRKYLFSRVELYLPQQIIWFTQLLNKNPSIEGHVWRLIFYIHCSEQHQTAILEDLHHISDFTLWLHNKGNVEEVHAPYWVHNWRAVSPHQILSISSFIQINTILCLSLSCIHHLPVAFLLCFLHLTTLHMYSISFCNMPLKEGFVVPHKAPKLITITSHSSDLDPLRTLLYVHQESDARPSLDISDLEDVTLDIQDKLVSVDIVSNILMTTRSLRTLYVKGTHSKPLALPLLNSKCYY